ncbi:MAG: polyprenyl synthetase family protein [Myxococcales bacterium]|nr:polyprenyl synthetase family protein [Myxococcales bacterium]
MFPGGARVRPELTLAIAAACGEPSGELADRAAAAIELLHCASLVHDDLPCFDDAAVRRGRPSVHARFGEPLAVLAGDALIVHALDAVCELVPAYPRRGPIVMRVVAAGVGAAGGIIAGQAWESEPSVDLRRYQRAKTGALFEAAILAGAASAGAPLDRWRNMGRLLGEAYQIADDIADVFASGAALGKPVGQDRAHQRPSAVRELDIETATRRLNDVLEAARDAVPRCAGREALRQRFAAITKAHLSRIAPPRATSAARPPVKRLS